MLPIVEYLEPINQHREQEPVNENEEMEELQGHEDIDDIMQTETGRERQQDITSEQLRIRTTTPK